MPDDGFNPKKPWERGREADVPATTSKDGYKLWQPWEKGWEIPEYPGAKVGYTGNPDDQYLRKWTLTLGKSGTQADTLDGHIITTETAGMDFRMTFKVRHADIQTPGTAEITIYNLSNATANQYIKEFSRVSLQAGYIHGHYGQIFSGTVKQFKKGRDNATDSYLTLYCADGDAAWNYAFLNTTIPAGSGDQEVTDAVKKSFQAQGMAIGQVDQADATGRIGGIGAKFLRGVVQYGLTVDRIRSHERTTGRVWSIQNGTVQAIKSSAYAMGDTVVINSGTGMIGVPEVTQDGIHVQCLLNPNLYVKQLVKLDNKSLNQYFAPGADPEKAGAQVTTYGAYAALAQYWASTREDGTYCIIVLDHEGDTRGQPWFSYLNCLNVDPTNSMGALAPGGLGLVEDDGGNYGGGSDTSGG